MKKPFLFSSVSETYQHIDDIDTSLEKEEDFFNWTRWTENSLQSSLQKRQQFQSKSVLESLEDNNIRDINKSINYCWSANTKKPSTMNTGVTFKHLQVLKWGLMIIVILMVVWTKWWRDTHTLVVTQTQSPFVLFQPPQIPTIPS